MRISRKSFLLSAMVLFCLFASVSSFAQAPSLASSDHYVVTIETENGEKENFTIIRDGRIRNHFYYVPNRPIVAYTTRNGKAKPIFQLMSYQTEDKNNELIQGGILQMSMVMGVSQEVRDKILQKITSKFVSEDYTLQYKLSPMPIKEAQITVYDLGGDMLDQEKPKGGIAPIFGTQHYPFMLKLSKLGSDMMEELSTKNGGLPVLITYTFQGMTPKAGFEVEVDWDACYEHFSTDTELTATVAKNAIGGSLGMDISTLREKFESEGLIKIDSLTNETVTSEDLDNLMKPILDMITKELFEQIHPPKSIPPAEAEKLKEEQKKPPIAAAVQGVTESILKATKRFFCAKAKLDFALKDVKIVKKGKFTYKFNRQAIVERTTSFGGLLGIGNYPKEVQDECITTMPKGNWESAYFVLPSVGNPDALGLREVNISITPQHKDGSYWKQISGYEIKTGYFNKNGKAIWTDKNNKEVTRFLYPLKALYETEGFDTRNYRFKVDTTISPAKGNSFKTTAYMNMFDGDLPIPSPMNLVDQLTIDGCCLTFGTSENEVYKAVGMVNSGDNRWRINLDQNNMMQTFLIPQDKQVMTSLKFAGSKGMLGNWIHANKPLRAVEPSLYFMLFDYDWEKEKEIDKLPEDVLISNPVQ
ncbi:MAG: hypothetical protein ACQETH_12860 [Candidatus Rifleibacteriota bacterium]